MRTQQVEACLNQLAPDPSPLRFRGHRDGEHLCMFARESAKGMRCEEQFVLEDGQCTREAEVIPARNPVESPEEEIA